MNTCERLHENICGSLFLGSSLHKNFHGIKKCARCKGHWGDSTAIKVLQGLGSGMDVRACKETEPEACITELGGTMEGGDDSARRVVRKGTKDQVQKE